MIDKIGRVTAIGVVPDKAPSTSASVGSAFAVAEGVLLTARHVVYPDVFKGPPSKILLDFPGGPPLSGSPFEAKPLLDPGDDDWILLSAPVPVTPFRWAILDALDVEADFAGRGSGRRFSGGGYPIGQQHMFGDLKGEITGPEYHEGRRYLKANVDASYQTSPRGFSGGPVLVEGCAVGMCAWAAITSSPLMGDPMAGGHLRVRPLADIFLSIHAVLAGATAALAVPLPPPHLLGRSDDPDRSRILDAAQQALCAHYDERLHEEAAKAYEAVSSSGIPLDQRFAFALALQRLVGLARPESGKGLLDAFLGQLAERLPGNETLQPLLALRRGSITPQPAPPPRRTGLALELRWRDGPNRVTIQVYEKHNSGYRLVDGTCETPIVPERLVLEACGTLLNPWVDKIGFSLPVEIITPFSLASLPFETAAVGGDLLGSLAPVTVRVRLDEKKTVDGETSRLRAHKLSNLRTPLVLGTASSDFPPDAVNPPDALHVACAAADAARWRTWFRPRPVLLVALDAPLRSDKTCPGYAALRSGVPMVAWERTHGRSVCGCFDAQDKRVEEALYLHRTSEPITGVTLVLDPPGFPYPGDDLLTTP